MEDVTDICQGLIVDGEALYKIVAELHEVGELILLGDNYKSAHLILKISELTEKVHESLSPDIKSTGFSWNTGILSEEDLEEVFPSDITKEQLIHLQYCQSFDHSDIGITKDQSDSESKPLLFFPALCNKSKDVPWDESTSDNFSIGWLALCTRPSYFPSCFHRILLLRLAFGFSHLLSEEQDSAHKSNRHSRLCTMWKRGVHWLMEEGVDCMVELVSGNQGVVVLTKSSKERMETCLDIFNQIITCVMKTKAEFCSSITPDFFLLDSTAEANYLNKDHMFAMSKVKQALASPDTKKTILSASGKRRMKFSDLLKMRKFTHLNTLFPISENDIFYSLREVVENICELGQVLGIPYAVLQTHRTNYPSDVDQRRTELVREWMKNSSKPPCWYTLYEALYDIDMSRLAEDIKKKHGESPNISV